MEFGALLNITNIHGDNEGRCLDMKGEEHRIDVVCYWWDKAQKSLAAAGRDFDAGAYEFAVTRLYYAVFYAVSAALLDRDLSFGKHTGVRAAFHQQFVKTGLVKTEWGRFYDRAFEDRQEGDYAPLTTFEADYVKGQMESCVGFLRELRPLVSALSRCGQTDA